jgi:hypothetical protein
MTATQAMLAYIQMVRRNVLRNPEINPSDKYWASVLLDVLCVYIGGAE